MEALYKMFDWIYLTANKMLYKIFKSVIPQIEEEYNYKLKTMMKKHDDEVNALKYLILSKDTQIQFYQNKILNNKIRGYDG